MRNMYIPGLGELNIENIVLDFNGTIALDGKIIDGVREKLKELAKEFKLYVITADTFGTAENECEELDVILKKINSEDVATYKRKIVESLGERNSICIGNGYNDIEMFKVSGMSVCTIQNEGASGKLFLYSDIVTNSILDALDIVLEFKKLKATLRG